MNGYYEDDEICDDDGYLTTVEERGVEDGDYTLSPVGHLGCQTLVAQYGKVLGIFAEKEDAQKFVRSHMETEQFWPNVWFISDHGNEILITV